MVVDLARTPIVVRSIIHIELLGPSIHVFAADRLPQSECTSRPEASLVEGGHLPPRGAAPKTVAPELRAGPRLSAALGA